MNTNVYTVLDLATYNWIEIRETTQKQTPKTPLVAKWIKSSDGKLYCSWGNGSS